MPLRAPNLDDRDFEQLLSEAKARVRQACPQWELSESDPAEVLLEAFAHLTEVMIYRLNRLPEKAYIEFLSLLGLRMQPPTAASAELTFSRSRATESAVEIPRERENVSSADAAVGGCMRKPRRLKNSM